MNRPDAVLSTYRLQFHKNFPFAAGAALAGYLRRLGVSHVYASPILTARAGSQHGYDVISYDEINPELGGIAGFRVMAEALRSEGLGIILDIVPNHVAVGGDDNAMWLDLLKRGRDSRYADWFDIDFDDSDPVLGGRVHVPFLGAPLQEVLDGGQLELVEDPQRAGFALRYGEHLYPIRTEDDVAVRAGGIESFREPEALRELLSRQHYQLDYWRNASDRLNWRRFFEITQLAGMRMENPDAFEAAHRLALGFYEEGLIDGLRIDHVDGLADPAGYCAMLRARLDALASRRPDWATPEPAWLIVEKILAPGEALPAAWGVDGTTGYDFMDQVSAVLHGEDADNRLGGFWSEISGRPASFADEEQSARREVLEHGFEGQFEAVVDRLMALASAAGREEDIPRGAMRRATAALCCHMRSYRTYLTGTTAPEDPGPFFGEALEAARAQPQAELIALEFIAGVMSGTLEALPVELRQTVIRRLNQLTSPLAARSVEDTAFYRYGRLLSRNDVGFDAARFAMPVADFHNLMAERQEQQPRAMLALATHDHKRGADVRARLATVSHDVADWQQAVSGWFEINDAIRPEGLDRGDEYQLYQMLLGTWPVEGIGGDYGERLQGWWQKALREAKLRTGWVAPNEAYETIASDFLQAALDPARSARLHDALRAYLDRIAPAAALNGLAQLVLQCTVPGVPDTYQGSEFWDFSMVDPDNRRPVDYGARERALSQPVDEDELLATWDDGRIKQTILHRLLLARRDHPALFAGDYGRLPVQGARADRVIAFTRENEKLALAVIVPIGCPASVAPDLTLRETWWEETDVALPSIVGEWSPLVGKAMAAGTASIADGGLGCHVLLGRKGRD
ncbi:hypothetical protein ASE63_12670 [Bosea sp. Root381]|uniref:malto-oligosyltrehalose synthase n=1 Tax=Bosea sp. Root381 TaxID=1736524 RepID=UPI0006FD2826|nr:malto-oligosyltrehalose synthase [Bosea sp. Root381]KRD95862.1 hypothetical protein ASE63_12670 [Bosea sp. Root381]